MKAYWHIPAMAALAATGTKIFQMHWIMVAFFVWLCYLFYRKRLGHFPMIVSISSFLFFLIYIPSLQPAHSEEIPFPDVFTGEIISPLTVTNKKIEFIVKEQETKENVLIVHFPKSENMELDLQQLKHGAACTIRGEIEIPPESRNPGQFDYQSYLLSSGIKYRMLLHSSEQIFCQGESLLQPIYQLRTTLLDLSSSRLSEQTVAWLHALVLGDDSSIEEDTIHLFQRWGLSHILAISGLHVGIVVGIVYFILVKLNLLTKEKAQIFMLCFLPVFTLLAGGEPSVIRAAFMAFLFIVIRAIHVKMPAIDVLSLVFLTVVLFDRYIVYHVGFQFSFIVTLALILSSNIISKEKSMLIQGLKISFISQMMILPLQFNYFSSFQPLSILLNTVVVPYFSLFVIPLMFLLLFLSLFPPVLPLIDSFFVCIHSKILYLIEWVDQLFYFPWVIGSFPLSFAVIYFVLFFLFMSRLERKEHNRSFEYGVMLTILLITLAAKPLLSPYGSVTMLDIGQGDAFIVELPRQKGVVMIDAGAHFSFEEMEPTDRNYEQIIKPYFYSKGISKIDALILTHDDIDHMGSAPFIIEEMQVEKIVVSDYYVFSEELINVLKKNRVQVQVIKSGDQLQVGEQIFYVLGPDSDQYSSNDNSIILYAEIGGKDWIFTGDISKKQERELIRKYPNMSVDVLKIAHHGSNTSTDENFIQQISPEFSLISVGENNAHGHPDDEVIELLHSNGTLILRTDMHGAVQFRYKEENGTFYRYLP